MACAAAAEGTDGAAAPATMSRSSLRLKRSLGFGGGGGGGGNGGAVSGAASREARETGGVTEDDDGANGGVLLINCEFDSPPVPIVGNVVTTLAETF